MHTSGNPDMHWVLYLFSYFIVFIYCIIKNILGIIIIIKYSRTENIKIEENKLLIIIPYIFVLLFSIIKTLFLIKTNYYESYDILYFMIILAILFAGNSIWLYYWIYMRENKNISKSVFYLLYGIYTALVIIFINFEILYYILKLFGN
jgi:hypothetical protein